MVELKLFNSLTGKKEVFEPLNQENIKIYVCGPTVYARPHIGNARSIVVYDLLYKLLKLLYPKVTYVRNITDIDDKIIDRAQLENISIKELTERTIKEFHEDTDILNISRPTIEPKATENITEIINMIQKLVDNGYAYESEQHVLFRTNKYESYGNLSGKNIAKNISGLRVEVADYKEAAEDFVLWKPETDLDDDSGYFESPWGRGRPGWHIECSAMSTRYLGNDFDIHGGGADLKFPHHENEIAQSCCANPGSNYAKYWVHNGFLTVNGEKMSKSLGNFITVRELLNKNIKPVVIRFLLLSTHYRKPLDFNDNALLEAEKFLTKAHRIILENLPKLKLEEKEISREFLSYLADDLNISNSFAYLHKKIKMANDADIYDLYSALKFLDLIDLEYFSNAELPREIVEKIELIKKYRETKNYDSSDKLREEILHLGYELQFKSGGIIEAVKKS